jgi:hypothetical protein
MGKKEPNVSPAKGFNILIKYKLKKVLSIVILLIIIYFLGLAKN